MARRKKSENIAALPRESGIYIINNTITGDFYIGSAINIYMRACRHLWLLKKNEHFNIILQNSWNKHGEANFKFEVLKLVDKTLILTEEQKYIDMLKPKYNIAKNVSAPMLGRHHSEEWKKNHSKIMVGRKRPEQSENFSGEGNPFYGKKHKKESIEKMRNKLINDKKSYGENNPSAKLTWQIVRNMRKELYLNFLEISKKYNISKTQTSRIMNNQCWKEN